MQLPYNSNIYTYKIDRIIMPTLMIVSCGPGQGKPYGHY